MAENIVGPFGAGVNETTTRPDDPDSGSSTDTWFQPCVGNIAGSGTKIPAVWLNKVTALLRRATRGMGIPDDSQDDDLLLKAIQRADKGIESKGATGAGVVDLQAGINAITNAYAIRKIRGVGITFSIDPTNGEVVATLGGGAVTLAGLAPIFKMEQQRAAAAAPQSFAGVATWTPRNLNTITANQITDADLISGQIHLPAGTYRGDFASAAFDAGTHIARLRDVTHGVTLINGISCDSWPSVCNASSGTGRFTVAGADTVVELQHYSANSNLGKMGDNSGLAGGEIHVDGWLSLIREA